MCVCVCVCVCAFAGVCAHVHTPVAFSGVHVCTFFVLIYHQYLTLTPALV